MDRIKIKGTIVTNDEAWVYELFEIEHTSPKMVEEAIAKLKGDEVVVEINSGGGSVNAGSEIYTAISRLNAVVEIVGLAGSAASFIAMAGKKVRIARTAQIMIHNASTVAIGDKHEMIDTSDFLNTIDSSIAYAYQLKTGLDKKELMDMMSKETWMTAEEAVKKGFADEIMFAEKVDAVASTSLVLPDKVINKVRSVIKQKDKKDNELLTRIENIEEQLGLLTNNLVNNPIDTKSKNESQEPKRKRTRFFF